MKKFLTALLILFGGCYGVLASAETEHLVISEIKIGGEEATDEYVEICNATNQSVSLSGSRLAKKSSSGREYTLVSDFGEQSLEAGSCLLVSHPDSLYEEGIAYTTSNSLASSNTVVLYNVSGKVVDKVGFGTAGDFEGEVAPEILAGEILSRKDFADTDNNAADFEILRPEFQASPTPEEGGQEEPEPYVEIEILVSELYPDPDSSQSESQDEWIELYNPNSTEVDLGGWALTDMVGSVHKYVIQPSTKIAPNGYLVLKNGQTKISLNNTGDSVSLSDKTGKEISSSPDFETAKTGESFASFDDGWEWTSLVTEGFKNLKEAAVAAPQPVKSTPKKASAKKASAKKTSKKTSAKKTNATKTTKKKIDSTDPNGLMVKDEAGDGKDLKKPLSSGIMLVLGGVVIGSIYLAYLNRDEIAENIYN